VSNLPQTYLNSEGMGHETLFLSPVRSKTKMKKKNPKKRIDLRPKPAVKEAEINQENKQTKVK
jgi:hypothetical protein